MLVFDLDFPINDWLTKRVYVNEKIMLLIKKNIVANYAGNIWQALMGMMFIPIYIKFLGLESYGLIGIFFMIQGMIFILDLGLTPTLTRELARLSVLSGKEQEMRNLVRSLEVVYWSVAFLIGFVTIAILPSITSHWVKADKLSPQTIENSFRIMGLVMALQWPASLYTGGLLGIQRQVLLNGINIGISTLRGAGAVLILWLVSPTIQVFFLWQIIIAAINTSILGLSVWRILPRTKNRTTFQKSLLIQILPFAAGMTGIAIVATILTQLDKIILSKMLTLEMFGYYSLAGVVAMSLLRLIGPVFSATYPKFTQLVSLDDQEGLKILYHKSCQLMSVLILPITVVVAMFSYEIMLLWTHNTLTAENTYVIVSILICGTALNGLMNIPGGVLLANGNTKLVLISNVLAIIILVPGIIIMTSLYGAIGAAIIWLILNASYVIVLIHFIHRLVLPFEKWRWYWQDVGLPLVASLAVAGLGRVLMKGQMSIFMMISFLFIISLFTLTSTIIVTPTTRIWLFNKFTKLKMAYIK